MKRNISRDEAEQLFNRGYRVGAGVPGAEPIWGSAAGINYVRTFDDLTRYAREYGDRTGRYGIIEYRVEQGAITNDDAAGYIFRREPFTVNNLSADDSTWRTGDLPEPDATRLKTLAAEARAAGVPIYVIRSYDTVIAYVIGDEVTFPLWRYSITTSQHQGLVLNALGIRDNRLWSAKRAIALRGRGKTPYTHRGGW